MMPFKKSALLVLSLFVATANVHAAARAAAGSGTFLDALNQSALRAKIKNAVGPDAVAALSHVEPALIARYLEAAAALSHVEPALIAGSLEASARAERTRAEIAIIQAIRAIMQAQRAAGGSGAVGAAAALNHVEPPTTTTAATRAVEARAEATAATGTAVRIEGPAGPGALAAAMALSRRADDAEQAARTLSRRADEAERAITPPAPAPVVRNAGVPGGDDLAAGIHAALRAANTASGAASASAASAPAVRPAANLVAVAAAPAPAPVAVPAVRPAAVAAGAHRNVAQKGFPSLVATFFAAVAGTKNHKITTGTSVATLISLCATFGRLKVMFNAATPAVKAAGFKAFAQAELAKVFKRDPKADKYVTTGAWATLLSAAVTVGSFTLHDLGLGAKSCDLGTRGWNAAKAAYGAHTPVRLRGVVRH